ncbi:MAG: asparagine synthase-related protein, partial [Nitrospiraceae bacterium]|nr:asparagine synthase-related protein [Nitrospiraceae bacterium]
ALGDGFTAPESSLRRCLLGGQYDFINRLERADFLNYLPDDILVKVDRASMFVSLEVRAPLLDYRVAEFSFANVPGSLKVKGMTQKYLLKKLAKKILPGALDVNRKWGFAIPVAEWFRGPLFNQLRDTLLGGQNRFFNRDCIEKLLAEHKTGINHDGRLFALLVFSLWWNSYLGDSYGY